MHKWGVGSPELSKGHFGHLKQTKIMLDLTMPSVNHGDKSKPMPLGCTALCRPMRGLSKISRAQLRPHPY